MWNKRSDEPTTSGPQGQAAQPVRMPTPAPSTGTAAAAAAAAQAAPAVAMNGSKPSAVIGPSMTIKGEIRAREELLVDGDVEGILESQSLLTVGPNGKVRGNIKARQAAIFGSVRGNVEVTEKIAIREQGSLIGDIRGAGISIDDGAYFKGSIDIVRPEPNGAKPKQAQQKEPAPVEAHAS